MSTQNPVAEIDKRYHIEAKLGQGSSGVVYRVYDNKLKRRAAIKLLRTDSAVKDSTQRFEREFHAISRLKHPNIIAVYDLAKNYFTMEFVEGAPLNPHERRDIHATTQIAIEICRALRYIHSQGIIHGDLKPAHILVTPASAIRLIDFGLSKEFTPSNPLGDPRVAASGTLEYMAPEQAKGMGIDPRADLYSLGVLLYELCTGRPPFTDSDPLALIMKQIESPPTPPRTHNPQIPRDLERLILKLLSKDPSARCQSADEVLSLLTQQIGKREVQESRVERGSRHLYLPRFVGRAREIAALEKLFQRAVRGEGAVTLLHGERGTGCSRLVGEFGAAHFFGGALAIHALCDPPPARPYAPFAPVAEMGWVLLEKRARPEDVARATSSLAGGLKRLSNTLSRHTSLEKIRPPLFADPRRLAHDLAGLLQILAQIGPVIVILEDVHWMDRLSCQLLERLAAETAGFRILLCLTAKDPLKGEVTPFHEMLPRLASFGHWHDLPLLPLATPEIIQIAASMLGRPSLEDPLAAKIVAAARGNPLVAQETMKGLAEQGILYKRGGAWHVDAGSVERVKPSEGLEDWLFEKASHLDKPHATVLAAASLIGRRISFDLLHILTEIDRTPLYTILTNLVHERLLSETEINRERVYAVASDTLLKTLYKEIDEGMRKRWHQRVAEALKAEPETPDTPIEEIARHYRHSRTPEASLPYYLRCAERAAGLLAYPQAIESFTTALEIGDEMGRRDDAPGILLRLGELYLEQDNRAEARRCLLEALERCRRAPEATARIAARAHLRLAEALLGDRATDEAARHIEKCCTLYGEIGDTAGLVQQMLLVARLHETQGEPEAALDWAARASEASLKIEAPLLQAEAALARGHHLNALGRFEEALGTLTKAERLYSSLEQAEGSFKTRLAQIVALTGLGQAEEARPSAERLRLDIENMKPPLQVRGYVALGHLEGRALQMAASEQMFDKAIRIAEEADDLPGVAEVQLEKARSYLAQTLMVSGNRRRDAIQLLKQAADAFSRCGMSQAQAEVESTLKSAEHDFLEGDAAGLKRERDDMRFLQKLSAAVNSELDLEKLLNMIMDMVVEVVRAERGFLILTEEGRVVAVGEAPPYRIAVARNIDQEIVDRPEFKISNTIAHRVIERREPILARDAQTDERFRGKISVLNLKLRSILCVPLLSKQKVIGAVYVDNRFVSERFNENNLRLLVAFADQAAIAIENARLYQDNVRRRRELEEANRSIRTLNEQLEAKMHTQGQELKKVREVLEHSQKALADRYAYHTMLGKSEAIQKVFHQLERLKETDVTVLLSGESGTGKDLVARLIHMSSPRKDKRFLSENCAAISPTLLESELFGHVRGAFTGAVKDKKGLFETVHKGTLFLDEIGEMSLDMQAKLLRVLENGELRPVGGASSLTVDVRIIAATNRDLAKLVSEGKFREDLFYRLNVVRLALPPLRDRREDIPLLLSHFLKESSEKNKLPAKTLSAAALRALTEYAWPGNVRELRSFAERALLLAAGETIQAEDALAILQPSGRTATIGPAVDLPASYKEARRQVLDAFNKDYLAKALERHGGNVSAAAREIGIERQYFYKILKTLELAGQGRQEGAEEPSNDEGDEPQELSSKT